MAHIPLNFGKSQFISDLQGGYQKLLTKATTILVFVALNILMIFWITSSDYIALTIFATASFILVFALGLQQRIWIVMLAAWALGGQTALLGIPVSPREATILVAGVVILGYRILAGSRRPWRREPFDFVILIFVSYIGITFMLHPAGLRIFGSDVIGARAYFTAALALVAYVILSQLNESPQWIGRAPYCLLVGSGLIAVLYAVSYLAPSVANRLPYLYAAVDIEGMWAGEAWGMLDVPRLERVAPFGSILIMVLCARYRPLTLLNPLSGRFWLWVLGLLCIFAGGYRGTLIGTVVFFALGTILRKQWRDLLLLSAVGIICFGSLIMLQGRILELPRPMQRTLCFLPGQWDPIVQEDARGSSEGRFKWWQRIWEEGSGGLIKNWWLGDGLGTSFEDWQLATGGEGYLVRGAYHNGPLTSIRCVGIIGLVLLYILMIYGAALSVQNLRRCQGTPMEMLGFFLAFWLIYKPVVFTLIFGDFRTDLPELLLFLGLSRLLIRMTNQRQTSVMLPKPAICESRLGHTLVAVRH